jgi:hypothetical protein
VPTVVLRPVLWEVADIVEQIFRIACTENLHPRPEEYDAYQADHGLTYSGMCEAMRQYGTLTEIHERAQVIALMRLYGRRWRPLAPGGGVRRGRRASMGSSRWARARRQYGPLPLCLLRVSRVIFSRLAG